MEDVISTLNPEPCRDRGQKHPGTFDATVQPRILQAVAAIRAAKERLHMSELHLQMQQERFAASMQAKSDG
ncbi:hypothetical protein B5M10_19480 [Pluralibacter gergoviae]|uniref:hypothetical protein n=1 Tax=Pluralibacter gergoviae TaxID=61647 RepID=UPI0005EC195B|nr:hypothetical protein [Pluralibacter gergoviae]KJM57817.1 hypothetical protein SS31_22090 [Pluralibacter gergoviae]OUQ94795.1 hypothetical protein B5M10_19480 [Pluralibacter gergoviae]